jgi:alkylation response protein AidB-like acyl-CoA dehydrogenase
VRFAFSEDQLAFRDAVCDLLQQRCPPAAVRSAWLNGDGRVPEAWTSLAAMGVLGAAAPESAGGLGLDPVDLVLVLEETGYAALPEPVVEHVAVGVPALAAAAADVAAYVSGTATVVTALPGQGPVLYADTADVLVAQDGDALVRVDRADLRLTETAPRVDRSRRAFEVTWPASAATPLGGVEAVATAFERGVLGVAAQLIGLARRMLDLAVAYVTERHQFGVPIGSFQAVKHHLADARIALEFARPLVYRAAWSLATADPDRSVHISMAKAMASDAATIAARRALQCHGAIGYSFEYDLHLFMKRAWALASAWGDAGWHRRRVGYAIL